MTRYQKYNAKKHYDRVVKIKPGEESHFTRRGKTSNALMSMGEVAKALGVSRQAVHQAERSAFRKIRIALMPYLKEMNHELAENI